MLRKLKVLISLAGLCCACATVQPVVTKVSAVVDCSEASVVSQLPSVVAEVVIDLLSRDYLKLLTDVEKRVGTAVLVCAVRDSADGASERMAATLGEQPNAATIRIHGEDYLQLRDVHFVQPEPSVSHAALPICRPACDACHVCVQFSGGGQTRPPTCAQREPKPLGCP